jgi:hypothetical protein
MKLKALVNFSYQNRSFKSGQEVNIEDEKMAETLLKSGHVEVLQETQAKKVSK